MNLDQYLKSKNISSIKFGDEIGVSGRSVDYYRSLERQPRRKVMQKIVKVTKGQVTPASFYE